MIQTNSVLLTKSTVHSNTSRDLRKYRYRHKHPLIKTSLRKITRFNITRRRRRPPNGYCTNSMYRKFDTQPFITPHWHFFIQATISLISPLATSSIRINKHQDLAILLHNHQISVEYNASSNEDDGSNALKALDLQQINAQSFHYQQYTSTTRVTLAFSF